MVLKSSFRGFNKEFLNLGRNSLRQETLLGAYMKKQFGLYKIYFLMTALIWLFAGNAHAQAQYQMNGFGGSRGGQ